MNFSDLQIQEAKYGINVPLNIINELREQTEAIRKGARSLKALSEEKCLQNRYERELCIFAFLRAELTMIRGKKVVSNVDALSLGEKLYPDIFDRNSVLLGLAPSRLATKFEDAKSIDEQIEKLNELAFHSSAMLIKHRLGSLHKAKEKFGKTEDLSGDSVASTRIDEPYPGFLKSSYRVRYDSDGEGWDLRISIYQFSSAGEQSPPTAVVLNEICEDTASRIAITWYEPWNPTEDLTPELVDLKNRLCHFCEKKPGKDIEMPTGDYHLPTCVAFLRFYNETEQIEDRARTDKLIHMPVCEALRQLSTTHNHENGLSNIFDLYRCSVPDWMFGELFRRQMLGSCWLESVDMEKIRDNLEHFIPKGIGFITHCQIRRKQKDKWRPLLLGLK